MSPSLSLGYSRLDTLTGIGQTAMTYKDLTDGAASAIEDLRYLTHLPADPVADLVKQVQKSSFISHPHLDGLAEMAREVACTYNDLSDHVAGAIDGTCIGYTLTRLPIQLPHESRAIQSARLAQTLAEVRRSLDTSRFDFTILLADEIQYLPSSSAGTLAEHLRDLMRAFPSPATLAHSLAFPTDWNCFFGAARALSPPPRLILEPSGPTQRVLRTSESPTTTLQNSSSAFWSSSQGLLRAFPPPPHRVEAAYEVSCAVCHFPLTTTNLQLTLDDAGHPILHISVVPLCTHCLRERSKSPAHERNNITTMVQLLLPHSPHEYHLIRGDGASRELPRGRGLLTLVDDPPTDEEDPNHDR